MACHKASGQYNPSATSAKSQTWTQQELEDLDNKIQKENDELLAEIDQRSQRKNDFISTKVRVLDPESAKWLFILLGIITYSFLVTPAYGDNCFSVPVSLSNITSCTNGQCTVKQTAYLAVPIADLSSACLQLVSPDGTTSTINLNVTISHAHWHHTFDYNYFTDGVVIDARAACQCGNNFVYSCDNCPAANPNTPFTQCITGTIYSSGGCSSAGTYCAKVGYTGYNRYKILHVNQNAKKDIAVVFTAGNYSSIAEYQGIVSSLTNQDQSITLTILSDTAPQDNGYDFVVFDRAVQDDFYLFEDSDINSINTYDVGKFGWYKTDQLTRLPLQFSQQNLVPTVSTCGANPALQYRSSMLDPGAFLQNRVGALASTVLPGALLVDPDWNPRYIMDNSIPNHMVDPFDVIQQGWLLSDQFGKMQPIGLNKDGKLIPVPVNTGTAPGGILMMTPLGQLNVTSYKSSTGVNTIGGPAGSQVTIYMVQVILPTPTYALCWNSFTSTTCNGLNVTATFWPEMVDGQIMWQNGVFSENFIDTVHNITESWFQHEINGGVLNLLVTFNNFTIKFDNTVVKPLIKSIIQDKDDPSVVWLEAVSTTVSGTCQIGTGDGILVTTHPITLTVSPQKFEMSLTYGPIHTDVQFIIMCYSNQVTKNARIDYSQQITSNVVTYNVSAQIYKQNEVDGSFLSINTPNFENPFSGMGDSVSDFFKGLFNLCFSCSLGSLIMSIVKLLIIIGGFIIALVILKVLFSACWRMGRGYKVNVGHKMSWWPSMKNDNTPARIKKFN